MNEGFFLDDLKKDLDTFSVVLMEILQNDFSNSFFFICESDDDMDIYKHYYNILIENYKHNFKKKLKVKFLDGKENVKKLHKDLSLREKKYDQVLFFIDRDYSYWTNLIYEDYNIYITDSYSIENNLVSDYIFINLLESSGIQNMTENENKAIKNCFNKLLMTFREKMKIVVAHSIMKQNDNIKLESKYKFNKMKDIELKYENKTFFININNIPDDIKNNDMIKEYVNKFSLQNEYYLVSGKDELYFMYLLYKIIYNNAIDYSMLHIKKKRKKLNFDIFKEKAMTYSLPPETLKSFLYKNLFSKSELK